MPIYDITLSISDALPVWPGDPPVLLTPVSHLKRGDEFTLSHLEIGVHTGTHVDAPSHFIAGGGGVDGLDLTVLVGETLVVHALEADAISADVLESLSIPAGTNRVLLRTRNSDLWARGVTTFEPGFVAITPDGAQWLVDHGVRLVGVDYLSVGSWDDAAPTHHVLLGAGVIAVEGLDLSQIEQGLYTLVCLPLKLMACEGAPARAILIENDH